MNEATILMFPRPARAAARLTWRDRLEGTTWQEPASRAGYDRLVIHERAAGDPPELDSYVSLYRQGEPWSRYGVARFADHVLAWCCRTGRDLGRFPSVTAALRALLPEAGVPVLPVFTDNVVRLA